MRFSLRELQDTPLGQRNAAVLRDVAAGMTTTGPAAFTRNILSEPDYSERSEFWHHGELMKWLRSEGLRRWPELGDASGLVLIHIPNERKASRQRLAILQGLGVRAGVSDLFLPLARGGYFGLWLELKKIGAKPTAEQKQWLASMRQRGYAGYVCEGWRAAVEVLREGRTG